METKKTDFLTYKGKPLVRCNDTIYYGSVSDGYIAKLLIEDHTAVKDMNVASQVTVQLINTNKDLNSKESIVKVSEKNNLYNAIDIADIWIRRAIEGNDKT